MTQVPADMAINSMAFFQVWLILLLCFTTCLYTRALFLTAAAAALQLLLLPPSVHCQSTLLLLLLF